MEGGKERQRGREEGKKGWGGVKNKKRCKRVPALQEEKYCRLQEWLPFLGCESTVVSGEKVCGNDGFNISLERTDWDGVLL